MTMTFTKGDEVHLAAADHDSLELEWHVSVHEGRVWLSEDAQQNLEDFTGRRLMTDNPREVLEFLDREAATLQHPTFSQGAAEMNFHGFAFIKSIRFAIEATMLGPDLAGPCPDLRDLALEFNADPVRSPASTLH